MKREETPKQMIQRVIRVAKILAEGAQENTSSDTKTSRKCRKKPQNRKTV